MKVEDQKNYCLGQDWNKKNLFSNAKCVGFFSNLKVRQYTNMQSPKQLVFIVSSWKNLLLVH